ncbi:Collagen alpha-1(XII) chain [Manis javanica]|nr:Collagen alpha-1(XII) chain [Manis javanica]
MLRQPLLNWDLLSPRSLKQADPSSEHQPPSWAFLPGQIEHQVTLEELQNLNALFQEYERRGRELLDMETFKSIMK